MTAKTCTKCKETKETTEFSKCKKAKDGLQYYCKTCMGSIRDEYRLTSAGKAQNKAQAYSLWCSMTEAQRASKSTVVSARARSDLSSADLYGGLSFTEACAMTLPFVEERLRLEAETGVAHHIDHIIPLSAGGTHTKENLQVLTAQENIAKGAN